VSVKIRLKRFGKKRQPHYRIVVMDSKAHRDGRALEEVGLYQPIAAEGEQIKLDEERVRTWLDHGAQPTGSVRNILNRMNIHRK